MTSTFILNPHNALIELCNGQVVFEGALASDGLRVGSVLFGGGGEQRQTLISLRHLSVGTRLNDRISALRSSFDPSRIGTFPSTVTSAGGSLQKKIVGIFASEVVGAVN